MKSRPNRICILNCEEADAYKSSGELPSHQTHPHISRELANNFTMALLFFTDATRAYEAYWVGKGKLAIKFHSSKSPQVTVGYTGYAGMQWIDGGSRWPAKS